MCCLLLLMRNQLHTSPTPQAETAYRMEIPGSLMSILSLQTQHQMQ